MLYSIFVVQVLIDYVVALESKFDLWRKLVVPSQMCIVNSQVSSCLHSHHQQTTCLTPVVNRCLTDTCLCWMARLVVHRKVDVRLRWVCYFLFLL